MRLRLITYNVHKCIGGVDRRYDPERVCATIAHYDPDLVLLQEVDKGARRSRRDCQVDVIGDRIGLKHRTYFPNVRVRGGGVYGNAILSRYPLADSKNIDLTVSWHKRRSVLHARYRLRLGKQRPTTRTLHVFNVHLGLSGRERRRQLDSFLDTALSHLDPNTPVVVAGDLNDVWGSLGKKVLAPAGFRTVSRPALTFPALSPLRPLDGVFVRGAIQLQTVRSSRLLVAKSASDHLPLIADMVLK